MGCCQPDDQTSSHDTYVVDCIANDMDHDSHHSEVTMVVPTMAVSMTVTVTVTMARICTVMFFQMQMLVVMMLGSVSVSAQLS